MLIIDDCSTDGSYELIKDYIKADDRIKLYRLEKTMVALLDQEIMP